MGDERNKVREGKKKKRKGRTQRKDEEERLHKGLNARRDQVLMIKKLRPETPQEIAMWIDERKRKYPTKAAVEQKVSLFAP